MPQLPAEANMQEPFAKGVEVALQITSFALAFAEGLRLVLSPDLKVDGLDMAISVAAAICFGLSRLFAPRKINLNLE